MKGCAVELKVTGRWASGLMEKGYGG